MRNHPPVICVGHQFGKPTYNLVNPKSGHVYATVDKTRRSTPKQPKPSSSSTTPSSSLFSSNKSHNSSDNNKHFRVKVAPGYNALLFLAIASAIDCNDYARKQQGNEEDMHRFGTAMG